METQNPKYQKAFDAIYARQRSLPKRKIRTRDHLLPLLSLNEYLSKGENAAVIAALFKKALATLGYPQPDVSDDSLYRAQLKNLFQEMVVFFENIQQDAHLHAKLDIDEILLNLTPDDTNELNVYIARYSNNS